MSNVQHQVFGDVSIAHHPMRQRGGSSLHSIAAAPAPGGPEAAALPKRLGLEAGDTRGLLPDLAGIAILVAALGAYGGFW